MAKVLQNTSFEGKTACGLRRANTLEENPWKIMNAIAPLVYDVVLVVVVVVVAVTRLSAVHVRQPHQSVHLRHLEKLVDQSGGAGAF